MSPPNPSVCSVRWPTFFDPACRSTRLIRLRSATIVLALSYFQTRLKASYFKSTLRPTALCASQPDARRRHRGAGGHIRRRELGLDQGLLRTRDEVSLATPASIELGVCSDPISPLACNAWRDGAAMYSRICSISLW